MPSQARRVQLTVYDQELDAVLDKVAQLQAIPKTKVIMNILIEMKPVLVDLVEALEMVKSKKDPTSLLMNMTSRLLGSLSQEVSTYNKFRDSSLAPDVQVSDTDKEVTEDQLDIFPDVKDIHHAND
jgi:uncharacterized protein YjcR